MKKTNLSLFVLLLLLFSSCKKATFIKVDHEQIAATISGTQGDIRIDTDGPKIEVEHAPSWITLTVNDEGTNIHYEMGLNTDRKLREDSLVIKSSDVVKVIPVRQSFKATYIKLDPTTVKLPKNGGTEVVNVEVDSESGLTVDDQNIASVDGHKVIIKLGVGGTSALNKKVTISCDDISTTLNVSQASNACPNCGGDGHTSAKCANCHGEGCGGCGYIGYEYCLVCYGSGTVVH